MYLFMGDEHLMTKGTDQVSSQFEGGIMRGFLYYASQVFAH